MHVVMVSKACLSIAYQKKLEEIARYPDIELTVLVPGAWRDPAGTVYLEHGERIGYQLIIIPMRFNGSYHLHYYPTLRKILSKIKPDLLHIDEEPYNLATFLALRVAKRLGIATLFFSWQNLNNKYPIPFRWMEQYVLSNIDYGLMGNQDGVDVWRAKGYAGRAKVIPQFGIDPDLFAMREIDLGRTLTIGVAGRRLVAEKGIDLLLHAVVDLPVVWRLRIAGEGPEKKRLEMLAQELGIADRVDFIGVINSLAVIGYLQSLDILVLPSRTLPNWKEQFGRVLIEAMACGVVVIGSSSGEIPHVIGEAGLVFAEGDLVQLNQCLRRLTESFSLREQLQQAGRTRVLEMYTQSQIAAQTVAVYREICP